MKWAKNTKYNAFIDAYHAPFSPQHCYLMGLLLFAITTHNIVAAMATDSPAPILSAGCVALGLVLLNTRIYKNGLQDSLETLLLINIVILTIATYNIRETNKNQLALANTSMAVFNSLPGYPRLPFLQVHSKRHVSLGKSDTTVAANSTTS